MFNRLMFNKKELLRKVALWRNPEGLDQNVCPECKGKIRTTEKGDKFCENYSIDEKKEGACCWHRYANGLNYWSEPEELITVLAKEQNIDLKQFGKR